MKKLMSILAIVSLVATGILVNVPLLQAYDCPDCEGVMDYCWQECEGWIMVNTGQECTWLLMCMDCVDTYCLCERWPIECSFDPR